MTPGQVIIQVSDLSKIFGRRKVVDRISLDVSRGEIFGFLGPNGSGKTTTIRMLCGLLTPDEGSGTCLGYDITSQSLMIKPLVGYMAQHFSLYEDLTVRENLEFIARLYDLDRLAGRVDEVIARLELGAFAGQLAGTLSGGWKQRLALASCLLHQPKVLLLDEPTAGVDPKARREFWDMINDLAAEGITSLISTHYMDEAERCHRLAYIAYGNLLTQGTVEEVVSGQGLTTWAVSGPGLHQLGQELKPRDGVDQVAAFGNTLHISGKDAAKLEAAIKPFMDPGRNWHQVPSSLEETFISLMSGQKEAPQ